MGNAVGNKQQPTSRIKNSQQVIKNIKISHPRFSNAIIVQDSGHLGGGYILVPLSIPSRQTYQDWQQKISRLIIKQKPLPLMLPKQFQFKQLGFCGTAGTLEVKYDMYPFMLSDQLQNRRQIEKHFEQPQLWYLIYTYVQTAALLHAKGHILGDVRPQTAFINQNGQIMLGNMCTFLQQQKNFDKTRFNRQTTFLAPQIVKQIQNGKDPKSNLCIAQCFSIGLTLLDAFYLSDSNDLYAAGLNLRHKKLNQRLRGMCNQRTGNLLMKGIISGLCHVEPLKRLSCHDIYGFLQPYEQQILSLSSFKIAKMQEYVEHRIFQCLQYLRKTQQSERLKSSDSNWESSQTKRQSNKVTVFPKDCFSQSKNRDGNSIKSQLKSSNFFQVRKSPRQLINNQPRDVSQPFQIQKSYAQTEPRENTNLRATAFGYTQLKSIFNQEQSHPNGFVVINRNQPQHHPSANTYIPSNYFGHTNNNTNYHNSAYRQRFPVSYSAAQPTNQNIINNKRLNIADFDNVRSKIQDPVSQIPFQYGSNIPSELLFDQQKYNNSKDFIGKKQTYNTGKHALQVTKNQVNNCNQYKTNPAIHKKGFVNQEFQQKNEAQSGRLPVNLNNRIERQYINTKIPNMTDNFQHAEHKNSNHKNLIPKVQHKQGMLCQMGRNTTSINPKKQISCVEISYIKKDDSGNFGSSKSVKKDTQTKAISSKEKLPSQI